MAEVIYGIQMWNEEENWWTPPRIPRPRWESFTTGPPRPRDSWNEDDWFGLYHPDWQPDPYYPLVNSWEVRGTGKPFIDEGEEESA